MTARPPVARLTRRVPLREVEPGVRLVLELDTREIAPVTRAFVRHIDSVRELLISGRISPDEAHAMLVDVAAWFPRRSA